MASGLDNERLSLTFRSRPDLIENIKRAADNPSRVTLFNDIASFVYDQIYAGNEPASKRRKLDATEGEGRGANGHVSSMLPARHATAASSGHAVALAAATEAVLLEIRDISVSLPQRKKLSLCFTKNYLYARAANDTGPVQGIAYAWKDIEHVFYVPVPEKAQQQFNYILFPRDAALASLSKATPPSDIVDPLIFTVPATAPKPGSVGGASAGLASPFSDSYSTLLHWALENQLRSSGNPCVCDVVSTNAEVFHSVSRQVLRPNEKAVHVRAFRGSKDGYLFFLPTGILWCFKKPLLFLPLDRIAAVSYTNVLQRTFNIVVEVDVYGSTEEVEFAMVDQEDYGTIDETYVRRHGLQDRSMAERRKAKRQLIENARGEGKRRGGGGGEAISTETGGGTGIGEADREEEDDGLTELQRAEKQLQDQEDELEEDYDPGSSGDSDGSNESSEDEGDGEDDDEEEVENHEVAGNMSGDEDGHGVEA
ncbi:negative regulator of DNA transposition protein [Niveomyces insectorum RCEF 264]|uniref:Negative regulator of DNA transposition protein n=1 Tax=Niveomyces insectorum RCEF 264 TaxID=1081102 RepID=A0A167P062_9HYPO|nr:negative regulator of DNA transposition protein [Niveomyces insectorum RCEF 264]